MRILGLDVGTKTIGVAVSDECHLIARGLLTLKREGMEHDMRELMAVIKEQEVGRIIVGLPINMNGSRGPAAEMVLGLVEELRRVVKLPVLTWDERLSTVAAQRVLLEADMSRRKRKKVVDKVAALLILQGYLDSQTRMDGLS